LQKKAKQFLAKPLKASLVCPNADEPQPYRRNKQEKVYPPNFTETTECRRKFFSANLGVFGVSRRKSFCFFCKDSLVTGITWTSRNQTRCNRE
jgi:hypothetical protein